MSTDLVVTKNLTIPAHELMWSFARSSGPGGQSVNTTDSKVTLTWNVAESLALSDFLKTRALERLNSSTITITVQRHRSQLQNRNEALTKLAESIRTAIAPPPRKRRPTRPSRGAVDERIASKKRRSSVKEGRRRPPTD